MIASRVALALCCSAVALSAQQSGLPPAPGRLVDVGGHRLHVICSGQGAPTVVLEAGASSFAIDWTLVQRDLARITRVCSYDRAGMGWSETAASTPGSGARDLHNLLSAAGEHPPT
jgi:pimeloyl-ACP methyl ester carboxylesterase